MFSFKVWANLLVFLWLLITTTFATTPTTKPGCPNKCGKVAVPYPFGFKPDGSCSLNQLYTIKCNNSFNPPKPFLPTPSGDFEIFHINSSRIRIKYNGLSNICYNHGILTSNNSLGEILNLTTTPFFLSHARNMFTTVGCSDVGIYYGLGGNDSISGCVVLCFKNQTIGNGPCSGVGCCQITIPEKMKTFQTLTSGITNHSELGSFNPCSYGFLAENGKYEFRATDLSDPAFMSRTMEKVPIVLDYVVGINQTCQQAEKNKSSYACQQNTHCVNFDNTTGGYWCNCLQGYDGNPYLSPGCTDINECAGPNNPCLIPDSCKNIPGSFKCSCHKGYDGDGRKNGIGCISNNSALTIKLGIGMSVGFLLFLIFISWLYFAMRRRKLMKLREKFFVQNGGILLKQKLFSSGESMDMSKIFTMDELRVATNNYSEDQVLGRGGHGIVYKGTLKDGQEVAIKKSKVVEQSQIEQFINEVIILTQINHRNVVKLLGCCLESEVPILVYEFIPNGTLYEHIHNQIDGFWLTWDNCVRLASETAAALAYLHSAASYSSHIFVPSSRHKLLFILNALFTPQPVVHP